MTPAPTPAVAPEVAPSVRTSLRIGRGPRRAATALSVIAIAVASALIWALASAMPTSAKQSVEPALSADRVAGPAAGLHPRVRHVDAAAMTARAKALAKAVAQTQQRARATSLRAEILRVAKKQLGDPYRAGSAGPHAFDCGGFTQFVFRRALGMDIARTSRGQYQQVERIRKKDARPGDLVFFFEGGAHHVGIYLGNGKMIDAPNPGESVSINPISGSWWGRSFTGIGRMLPA